ncbi:MAG: YajG family lipoprotein [Planctomycetota bacterium]
MKKSIYVFLLVGILVINGCAYISQQVKIMPDLYVPESNVGQGKNVILKVKDERSDKILGHRGSGFGKAAAITNEQDIPAIVQDEIIKGLQKKGFISVSSDSDTKRILNVEIRLIEYSTSIGFWTGGIQTKATLKAIASNNGKIYENLYRINNEKRVVIVPAANENERLVNEVITQVLEELFRDENLFSFLASE